MKCDNCVKERACVHVYCGCCLCADCLLEDAKQIKYEKKYLNWANKNKTK